MFSHGQLVNFLKQYFGTYVEAMSSVVEIVQMAAPMRLFHALIQYAWLSTLRLHEIKPILTEYFFRLV